MKPPYTLNSKMLLLCAEIARTIGQLEGLDVAKPALKLRKSNRARSIQGSLAIEGNTLALDQVTAILEGKSVIAEKREVLEVKNAIKVYDVLSTFKPRPEPLTAADRLEMTRAHCEDRSFSRKEYLTIFKTISTATASRDLAYGVKNGILLKTGDKAVAAYRFKQ